MFLVERIDLCKDPYVSPFAHRCSGIDERVFVREMSRLCHQPIANGPTKSILHLPLRHRSGPGTGGLRLVHACNGRESGAHIPAPSGPMSRVTSRTYLASRRMTGENGRKGPSWDYSADSPSAARLDQR